MTKKKTVLAMDDSTIILEGIKTVLEAAGYAVVTANRIAELDVRLAQVTPDLVVLDVQMPEAFGDDIGAVLRKVRKASMPIILFSSVDQASLAARVKEAKLDGWVSKSAGLDALLVKVKSLLS